MTVDLLGTSDVVLLLTPSVALQLQGEAAGAGWEIQDSGAGQEQRSDGEG